MRVYLAGKIRGSDGWRELFVPGWGDMVAHVSSLGDDFEPRWEANGEETDGPEWPTISGGFLGIADYVGPYAAIWRDEGARPHDSCVTLQGGLHVAMPPFGNDYESAVSRRKGVTRLCLSAIDRADVVVAILTDEPSPGTLCEIGYAVARSRPVIAVTPQMAKVDWFPLALSTCHEAIYSGMPAFFDCAARWARHDLYRCLSRTLNAETYYRSPWWKGRRQRALDRADNKCQFCATALGLSVHHNTYANVYREPDSDLVVLCDPCHRAADVKRRARERETATQGA